MVLASGYLETINASSGVLSANVIAKSLQLKMA